MSIPAEQEAKRRYPIPRFGIGYVGGEFVHKERQREKQKTFVAGSQFERERLRGLLEAVALFNHVVSQNPWDDAHIKHATQQLINETRTLR